MKDHNDGLAAKMAEKVSKMDKLDEEGKKKKLQGLDQLRQFEYVSMDATRMDYREGSFDLVIDKGTYDALACGTVEGEEEGAKPKADKSMIKKLTQEMVRVTRTGGAVVIITNGTPEKRLNDLKLFAEEAK